MRTFTQLTGTTVAGANPGSFVDLAQNNSLVNVNLSKTLVNGQHRYYLQKYFDNERTYTTLTVGAQTLTLTATPNVGDTSATLSVAWVPQTTQQLVVFPDAEQRTVFFTQGSANISWLSPLAGKRFRTTAAIPAGATSATLQDGAWASPTQTSLTAFSDGSTKSVTFTNGSTAITWIGGLVQGVGAFVLTYVANTSINALGVQSYPIPANVSKIKNDSITVGQLVYQPAPVQSIQEWTQLNAIPYTSDLPAYFYIYQNQVNFWPIPSTPGNVITFNYKARVADMTYADYSVGTIAAVTAGSNIITGAATVWTVYPQNVDLSYANLMIRIDPPNGDGLWYPIQRFTSATSVTLNLPIVNAPSATGTSYTIAQFPLLQEDFQDLLVYSSLSIYYSSIVQDESKFKMYDKLTKEREDLMKAYLGTKSVNVDLGAQPTSSNPNLYLFYPPH